jgi:hypothetical protein
MLLLIDGKDPFAIEFPNFFRCYSAQKTQVILLDGLRSAGIHLRRDTVIPQWFQASKAAAASDGHGVHC